MTGWSYFTVEGEQVQPSDARAAFKAHAVQSNGVSNVGSPTSAELAHWEYQDVHPIGRPDLWMNFGSLRELKRGLVELGLKAKGKAR